MFIVGTQKGYQLFYVHFVSPKWNHSLGLSVLVEPLGFPDSSTVSSVNREVWLPLTGVDAFSSPCVFPMVGLLGLRGDILVLFLLLGETISGLHHRVRCQLQAFLHGLYSVDGNFLKTHYAFYVVFVKCFFYNYWDDRMIFVLSLVNVMDHVDLSPERK